MKLAHAMAGVARLFLDTAPVIYYLEGNTAFQDVADAALDLVAEGAVVAVTSPVTLAECCVLPMGRGDLALVRQYRDLLVAGRHTEFATIDERCAVLAADLRGRYRLRLPDALQFAVAIRSGCDAFLTNDEDLKRVQEITVLVLSELEA